MTYVLCSLKPQDSIDRNFIFVQFHVGKWLRYSRLHCTTNNDVFVYTVCMSKRGFPAALLHRLIYCTLQNTVCSPILLQKKMHIKTNETLEDGGYRLTARRKKLLFAGAATNTPVSLARWLQREQVVSGWVLSFNIFCILCRQAPLLTNIADVRHRWLAVLSVRL